MKKTSLASSILIGTITLSSFSAPLTASAAETNASSVNSNTDDQNTYSDFKQVKETKVFTNQQLFDELESQGYELTDIFTEEEIESYKAEDKLRAGQTTLNIHNDGTATLYLSSAYTKTISGLGVGAGNIIGGVIGFLGGPIVSLGGSALGGFLGQIASTNLDTTKGIYIKFAAAGDDISGYVLSPSSWGYQ